VSDGLLPRGSLYNPRVRAFALVCAILAAVPASAERDGFGLGDGHLGPSTFGGTLSVNTSAPLQSAAPAGAMTLQVGDGGYVAGELLLLVQIAGADVPDAGTAGPFDVSDSGVGRWELARVASVAGAAVTLTAPLENGFAPGVTLATNVPEYTDVTLMAGTVMTASPWDGASGGVVAFLATGTVTNSGAITADGLGFRGGLPIDDPAGSYTCLDLNEPSPLGAERGEGISLASYGPMSTGFGNVWNGGGGGNCHNAGGGGGGNGSRGGTGGVAYDGPVVGGLGGGALSCQRCLAFGGGGGTSHQHAMGAGIGGAGGGIVFIRAQKLAGTGAISANGTCGGQSYHDGSGGGGAGGTLYLRFSETVSASLISAQGGDGGSIWDLDVGRPGGAGGAGRVLLQGTGALPSVVAQSGLCGLSPTTVSARCPTDFSCGAEPDQMTPPFTGVIEVIDGGLVVPAVSFTFPLMTTAPDLPLTGDVTPGAEVVVELDGVALSAVTASIDGSFRVLPPTLAAGTHHARGRALWQDLYGPWSADVAFTVSNKAPPHQGPSILRVSCSEAGGPALSALLLLLAYPRRRRRVLRHRGR
jgi:hypothetical protein